jgi:tRNA A-37 threonylcarbamoyl transferase component Bud32
LKIAKRIASVCAQLHSKGINHGDLYAHNILINKTPDCLFGDFGATPFYDINSNISHNIELVESRAFGCLLEDLLSLVIVNEMNNQFLNKWQKLITDCTTKYVKSSLSFNEILEELNVF